MQSEYYNINDLEKLSGIKAHTIRMWEKRYDLLHPHRTPSNIRYYTSDDLKKLLNISILNKNGLKISHIAMMRDDEIKEKVIEYTTRRSDTDDQIQALTMAMFNFDMQKFEKLLTVSYLNRGFESTYTDIISPFLAKMGYLWQSGTLTIAQEHFAINLIRRKIIVATDSLLASYSNDSKRFLLFLPQGELNEINLLFAYYLLKKNNHIVTYLGISTPLQSVDEINTFHNEIDYIITSFNSALSLRNAKDFVLQLSEKFPAQKIIILGGQVEFFKNELPSNVFTKNSCNDFVNFTESLC